MADKTLEELVDYVQHTLEIDESGDANMAEYLFDLDKQGHLGIRELFVGFLIWANGENWEQFLDHAKVGDIPPGGTKA